MSTIMRESEIEGLERFSFGDSGDLADSLLALVLAGEKTATCWDAALGQLTEVGRLMVACDGEGRPRAVLRTVKLVQSRFCDVSPEFARKEGEGDRSLDWWRDAHENYFRRSGEFSPEMMLWCEDFEVTAIIAD
jgi:uncharacterized protein YhfF